MLSDTALPEDEPSQNGSVVEPTTLTVERLEEKILEKLKIEIVDKITGYLKTRKTLAGQKISDLDIIGGFIHNIKYLNKGGQYFVFEGEIDWGKAREQGAFRKFFTHILAHQLAAKDNLEDQLKNTLNLTLDSLVELRIDDDLYAHGRLKNGRSVDYILGYNLREIRPVQEDPEKSRNYIARARNAITDNKQDIIDHLVKIGLFQEGDSFNDATIERVVKNIFESRGIFKNNRCIIKVSKYPVKLEESKDDDDFLKSLSKEASQLIKVDLRSKRERNFVGLLHQGAVPMLLMGYAFQNRIVYISNYFENDLNRKEMAEKFSLESSMALAHQLARMICFYNRLGVINRDIKPDNIMTDGVVSQMNDFGLAGYYLEEVNRSGSTVLTQDGQVLGTLAYMPFEQTHSRKHRLEKDGKVMNVSDTDIRADIYAVIGTFYELIMGHAPNVREGEVSIASLLAPERPAPHVEDFKKFYLEKKEWTQPWRKYLSSKYHDKAEQWAHDFILVMAAGLNKDRNKRYQRPEQLRDDFQSIINLKRPKHVFKIMKTNKIKEPEYVKGAFALNLFERPSHFLRKLRQGIELAASTVLAPAVLFPEQSYQFLQKGYNFIQTLF